MVPAAPDDPLLQPLQYLLSLLLQGPAFNPPQGPSLQAFNPPQGPSLQPSSRAQLLSRFLYFVHPSFLLDQTASTKYLQLSNPNSNTNWDA